MIGALLVLLWLAGSSVLALILGAVIRRRDRQVAGGMDRQCPVRLDDGRRCKWYRTHPAAWEHEAWGA